MEFKEVRIKSYTIKKKFIWKNSDYAIIDLSFIKSE